jgi:hypothetical protein
VRPRSTVADDAMSESRPDGPFEVPVHRLDGGRREGRRGAVVAIALVAVVGGAFGLARLSGDDAARPDSSVAPDTALASGSPDRSPRASATASRGTLTDPRVERLLDVPNWPIEGGPAVEFTSLTATDARFSTWTPGGARVDTGAIRGVRGATEEFLFPMAAPSGTRQMILFPVDSRGPSAGKVRIVNGLGHTIWTGTDIATASGGLWSDDGSLAVLAADARRWHLVSIAGSGSTRTKAVDTIVELPGEVFLPVPIPTGSITLPRVQPRTIPLGFSADGRWIYGGVVSPELGILVGEFRVRVDGGSVERVADFGVSRPDGLLPRPGTDGGRIVDPVTGRTASWRVNENTPGGAPTLEVRHPDNGFAFSVDVPALLGSAWGEDGSLYVLSADAPLFPDHVALARVDRDGGLGVPILETGSVTGATLLDVRGGYAALIVWAADPDRVGSGVGTNLAGQVVLVDLTDPGRISALPLASLDADPIADATIKLPTGGRR